LLCYSANHEAIILLCQPHHGHLDSRSESSGDSDGKEMQDCVAIVEDGDRSRNESEQVTMSSTQIIQLESDSSTRSENSS